MSMEFSPIMGIEPNELPDSGSFMSSVLDNFLSEASIASAPEVETTTVLTASPTGFTISPSESKPSPLNTLSDMGQPEINLPDVTFGKAGLLLATTVLMVWALWNSVTRSSY